MSEAVETHAPTIVGGDHLSHARQYRAEEKKAREKGDEVWARRYELAAMHSHEIAAALRGERD